MKSLNKQFYPNIQKVNFDSFFHIYIVCIYITKKDEESKNRCCDGVAPYGVQSYL